MSKATKATKAITSIPNVLAVEVDGRIVDVLDGVDASLWMASFDESGVDLVPADGFDTDESLLLGGLLAYDPFARETDEGTVRKALSFEM